MLLKILIKCSWYSIVTFPLVIHTKFLIKKKRKDKQRLSLFASRVFQGHSAAAGKLPQPPRPCAGSVNIIPITTAPWHLVSNPFWNSGGVSSFGERVGPTGRAEQPVKPRKALGLQRADADGPGWLGVPQRFSQRSLQPSGPWWCPSGRAGRALQRSCAGCPEWMSAFPENLGKNRSGSKRKA